MLHSVLLVDTATGFTSAEVSEKFEGIVSGYRFRAWAFRFVSGNLT
jgi:hypothetical protein